MVNQEIGEKVVNPFVISKLSLVTNYYYIYIYDKYIKVFLFVQNNKCFS